MARAGPWRGGADRVRFAGDTRSRADVDFVLVRLLLLHGPERRQPGVVDGACTDGRRLGLVRARAAAGRRARSAADGAGGDSAVGRHARVVSVGGSAATRCAVAYAELVSRRYVLRGPHDRVLRAVAGVAVRLPARPRRSAAPAAHRRARPDRLRADHAARLDRLGAFADAALALVDFWNGGRHRLDPDRVRVGLAVRMRGPV